MPFLLNHFWFLAIELKATPFHYVRFEKDTRYYEFRLTKDLFGGWVIILGNGRIKTKFGQLRTHAFSSFTDALLRLYELIKIRIQRNYYVVASVIDDLIFLLLFHRVTSYHTTQQPVIVKRKIKAPVGAKKNSNKQINSEIIQFQLDLQEYD